MHPDFAWIESGGGPLILLPKGNVGEWAGVPAPPSDPISGDYQRAVDVEGDIGTIPVGPDAGLVLAGEPLPAALLSTDGGAGLLIVRWISAPNDESARQAIVSGSISFVPESFLFDVRSPGVVLMDAASPGTASMECLECELAPGTYAVATAELKSDPETHLLLHRLERL